MKNKIEDLRNHLFETLEALKDPDKPMELDRASAIADVARVIVDSAKAEVDFLKVTGGVLGSGFIPTAEASTTPALQGPAHTCQACGKLTKFDPCEHCKKSVKRVA